MSISKIKNLSGRDQAIVAIAILLEGSDAALYLEGDCEKGEMLAKAAEEFMNLDLDLRLSLAGAVLRDYVSC